MFQLCFCALSVWINEPSNTNVFADSTFVSVTVNTLPDSSMIVVDGAERGIAPVTLQVAMGAKISVTARKVGYVSTYRPISLSAESDTSIVVKLYLPSSLTITSIPESARVHVGSRLAGRTPVTVSGLPPDSVAVTVDRALFESWSTVAVLAESSQVSLLARLTRRESAIDVFVQPVGSSVFIDDAPVSRGSLIEHRLSEGQHRITVRDETSGREQGMEISLGTGLRYSFQARLGYRSMSRGVMVVLIPGSAHLMDGAVSEGGWLLVGSGVLAYLTSVTSAEYRDQLGGYDRSYREYIAATLESEATRRFDEVKQRKSDLDNAYLRKNIIMTLFASCYVYAVVDGLMHHLFTDDISLIRPYNPTMDQSQSLPLNTIGLRWSTKIR